MQRLLTVAARSRWNSCPMDDRITPPEAASFSVMMLGSTPSGDAYTFAELEGIMKAAGFSNSEIHQLPPSIQQAVISQK
jgi:hypothetical protein